MAGYFKDFVGNLRKHFDSMNISQRIIVVILLLTLFISFIGMAYIGFSTKYTTLYSNQEPHVISQIVEVLQAENIRYRISDNGRDLEVESRMRGRVQVMLAGEGVSGVGASISGPGLGRFDKVQFGQTEFAQRVQFVKALEEELESTISSFPKVRFARVHIVLERESLFIEEEKPSKASVVVDTGFKRLSPEEVRSITLLVSNSVVGLTIDNISVIDINGNVLSQHADSDEDRAFTDFKMTLQSSVESGLERKIANILAPIVGMDRVRVQVTADIDFRKVTMAEEIYDPDRSVVRSEQRSIQESSGGGGIYGVPGVDANLGEDTAMGTEGLRKSSKEDEIIGYELSKMIRNTQKSMGGIQRLSVAVIVDDAYFVSVENGRIVERTEKRTEEELMTLRELVSRTVGYNEERGDVIKLSNISFDRSHRVLYEHEMRSRQRREMIEKGLIAAGIVVALIFLFVFLIKPMLTWISLARARQEEDKTPETRKLPSAYPKTVQELERELEDELDAEFDSPIKVRKSSIIKKRIIEMAQSEPERLAGLMKYWLVE